MLPSIANLTTISYRIKILLPLALIVLKLPYPFFFHFDKEPRAFKNRVGQHHVWYPGLYAAGFKPPGFPFESKATIGNCKHPLERRIFNLMKSSPTKQSHLFGIFR